MVAGSVVILAMVLIELSVAGSTTLSKAAMNRGMSNIVFIFYTHIVAIFIMLPASFFYYGKRSIPSVTLRLICRIFLLALVNFSLVVFLYTGIKYSSPALSAVMIDLAPAFTFVLAIIFKMEKLDLRIRSSQARSIGTIVSICGALILTLYKGPPIINSSINSLNLPVELLLSAQSNWIIGSIMLAASGFLVAVMYIVQTWIMKDYPEELIVTSINCVFVSFLSAVVSLFAERDPNAWKIKRDMRLLAIIYTAVFPIAIQGVVHTWACHKKGPVFASSFKPLTIIFATALGIALLGDNICLGSVIGPAIVAIGFYAVLWGQSQQEKTVDNCESGSSSLKVDLLPKTSTEV